MNLKHHPFALVALIVPFLLAAGLPLRSQHCPFDNAALIAVEVRAHGSDSLIPNLRVTLLHSIDNPLRNGSAEYLFWRNPVDSSVRTAPDRVGWGREHVLFRFAGDRYVRPLGMSVASGPLFVRVEDIDGYAGGGYFESAVVPVERRNITSLCENNPDEDTARDFAPIVIELRTNATMIGNGEPDIMPIESKQFRGKMCRCSAHVYCGCNCCLPILERPNTTPTISRETVIGQKEHDQPSNGPEIIDLLATPECDVPYDRAIDYIEPFRWHLVGIYPHATGADSAIPNLRFTLLNKDGVAIVSSPGPRPFLHFDSDRGVPPGQRSCVHIEYVDSLEDIFTLSFRPLPGLPSYLVVEDVDGRENGGRFKTDTIAIPAENILIDLCPDNHGPFFVPPIEVVLERDDRIYDGEILNQSLLDEPQREFYCNEGAELLLTRELLTREMEQVEDSGVNVLDIADPRQPAESIIE